MRKAQAPSLRSASQIPEYQANSTVMSRPDPIDTSWRYYRRLAGSLTWGVAFAHPGTWEFKRRDFLISVARTLAPKRPTSHMLGVSHCKRKQPQILSDGLVNGRRVCLMCVWPYQAQRVVVDRPYLSAFRREGKNCRLRRKGLNISNMSC